MAIKIRAISQKFSSWRKNRYPISGREIVYRQPKIKANYYRLYGLVFEDSGNNANAGSFIEKSIDLNPDRFSNYVVKLSIIVNKGYSQAKMLPQRLPKSQELLDEIEKVEKKFLNLETSAQEIMPF